jgi:alpha-D-xyloside xylohydrolase
MRPYLREVMRQAHDLGDPVMRPMFYGYPDDERSWTVDDQYLFGPDLLVAPVVEAGARDRDVYLPPGSTWTELHSGRTFEGGQVVPAQAALAVIPVYARDGTHRELVGTIYVETV